MSRGDADYFILITTQNNNIIDYKEIGSIGDENPVTFKILPAFSIENTKGIHKLLLPLKSLKLMRREKL
ncbi:hypothetical protein OK18_10615 [Chryseobacterium gallinarum]|uniref:Uncharacterized protein n=1 Tax=Chryseobacterium gallinarum TaxID=1324352 RepID=A0A0G3M1J9_CHRGL|nr:hypothetical protein OK18_10615 [Chryseobacterium gallinarum]